VDRDGWACSLRSHHLAWQETQTPDELLDRLWTLALAFVLCTLTLHPWYLLWLVPFLVLQPRLAWVT